MARVQRVREVRRFHFASTTGQSVLAVSEITIRVDLLTSVYLISALLFFLVSLLLLQGLLDEGILQDGELLALLARCACHDLFSLLRAMTVPDHVSGATHLGCFRRMQTLVGFSVLKGSYPPLLE